MNERAETISQKHCGDRLTVEPIVFCLQNNVVGILVERHGLGKRWLCQHHAMETVRVIMETEIVLP